MQNDQKNITNGKSEISHSFNLIQNTRVKQVDNWQKTFYITIFLKQSHNKLKGEIKIKF